MTEEQTVSRGELRVEDVKALVDREVKRAVDETMARGVPEEAEPLGWWNLWAIGPIQPIIPGGPLRPHKIIKIGEPFYVATILWLNPWLILPNGPSVCDLISNLGCDFEIKYCTGNVCTWTLGPRQLNVTNKVDMVPDQCYYVDVKGWMAQPGWEGCYEMNICARITGCPEKATPPLAGFVTAVRDIDADLFYPPPGPPGVPPRWEYDIPIRFMIYP